MHISRREFVNGIGGLAATVSLSPLWAQAREAAADGVQSIGSRKVLLLDRTFIAKSVGVQLKLHPPKKTGERLLESEHPWESATLNWFSVLQDGDKYRMWYECYDVDGWPTGDDTSLCYAESTDGIRWTKPKLGLVAYRGSKENNILFRQIGEGKHRSRVHGSCVFIDPSAPPAARYKCLSQGLFQGIAERPYFVAGMTSPDGWNWTRIPQPICRVFADSQYSGFWDARLKRYAIFGRVSGRGGRAIGRSTSDRFETFAPFTLALEMDAADAPGADLYNPACIQYPGSADHYLMFPSVFRHKADTLEIRLAVSRDGETWTWPDRETPFIGLGQPGDFDGGSLYMGNGACQPTGEDLSFYFSGSSLKHEEVELEALANPKNRRVISRAVTPKDRLVSATATARGQFETPPLRFTGNRLVVNAASRPQGQVRVGLLTADGQPISGHSVEDCQPLTEDRPAREVKWGNGQPLATLAANPVRLRFELQNADLFGFQFTA